VAPEPLPVAPEPAHDRDLELYRHAHEKHFRARDFAAALRAWDLYLQAFPSGTFAVEARYNRAICLVRLGQKAEARRALLPFSKGEVARGYRQAEATELLKALE
jgi:TolA-binding protein